MFEIYEPAYTFVDDKLSAFLNTGLGNVMDAVRGPLAIALTLYVVLYGWAILRGSISEPVMDGVNRLVKLCFIYSVATTVAYNSFVTQPLFTELPNWLAGAISGGPVASIGGSFDEFLARGILLAEKIFQTATVTDFGPYITGGLVVGVTAIATAIGFAIVMIAKVALALLVALGPIFIACMVFEASRSFFYGWLRQAVNYLILFALIIAIFQMILALIEGQWGNISAQSDPEIAGILFMALCALGAIFFLQTPNMAAGIAGGAAAGLGDFANAARAMTSGQPVKSVPSGNGGAGRGGGSVAPSSTSASRNGHPRR